jgi:aryl-alcohol dehydrogenase-like predicted oxidoreductase
MQSLWASDKHGFESFVSIQPEYSLVAPVRAAFELDLAPVCLTYGIWVLPYSPLAGGFLTGKYRRGQPLPESVRARGQCAPDDRSKLPHRRNARWSRPASGLNAGSRGASLIDGATVCCTDHRGQQRPSTHQFHGSR